MKKLIFITFYFLYTLNSYPQENAFPILKDNSGAINTFLPSIKTNTEAHYFASKLNFTNNTKLVGINLTFKNFDITNIDGFKVVIYANTNNIPGTEIYSETVHQHNYYCNAILENNNQNMDLFLRNPAYLNSGSYWLSVYAIAENTNINNVNIGVTTDTEAMLWNGTNWTTNEQGISYKLYGAEDFGIINTYPYSNSFGKETMVGWNMSDLFPTGIDGFIIDDSLWSENDTNNSSLRISGRDESTNTFDRFIFYNVTTPKFRFEANRTYKISCKAHPVIYGNNYSNMGALGFVFVPDPPELGHLQHIGSLTSSLNPPRNRTVIKSNTYFEEVAHIYTPSETTEIRIALHMEFGAMPLDETVHFWIDEFKVEDITTLSTDSINNDKFKIFPNPATENIHIDTSEEIQNIKIYNLLGQLLINTKKTDVSIENLKTGVYIISIKTLNQTSSFKFIKE